MPEATSKLISFYTELRYEGSAEQHITRFSGALRSLLRGLEEDLGRRGEARFGGRREDVLAVIGKTVPAMLKHVDAFEAAALGASEDPKEAKAIRNVIANIAADHDLAGQAKAQASAPKANEAKFDQGFAGALISEIPEISNKMNDLSGAFPPLGIIGAIIRDIGIVGRAVFDITGGDEVGEQLENKLDFLIAAAGRLEANQATITAIVERIEKETTRQGDAIQRIDRETQSIEFKAELLAKLLGQTLVGEPWIVDPNSTTTSQNKTPARDVKTELHDIEDLLRALIQLITRWKPPPPGKPLDPPEDTPKQPVLFDRRLKKIFVYEQDVFRPTATAPERVIDVRTDAFDLFAWLDLTKLRPGDVVEVESAISIAGRPPVVFERKALSVPKLYSLADFARGESKLSGDWIRVTIRQTASADGFRKPIELPYQLVVESQ
ncbi:MAG: hypothetical protein R3A51_12065 [Nannocystaceae bacterium]|nr:hypothetical protein [Myxococcales bacterium]